MAQKGSKKREVVVDEESDIFLSYINKKLRNVNKKLDQIKELEGKEKNTLKPEQLDKINSKSETLEQFKYFDKIKEMYHESHKLAKEEGRTQPVEKKEIQEVREVIQPKEEVNVQAICDKHNSDILNLVHFAQLYNDHSKRDELKRQVDKHDLPDFDVFYEFYTRVFLFSESNQFEKVGSKIETSANELKQYLNSKDSPAVKNRTYKYLHDTVERIASTQHFKDQKAEVHHQKSTTSHHHVSAIGSELKHEKTHDDHKANDHKHDHHHTPSKKEEHKEPSPTKQHHHEKDTKHETVAEPEKTQSTSQTHHTTTHHEKNHHHDKQHHGQHNEHHEKQHSHKKRNWDEMEENETVHREEKKQDKKSNEDDDGFITITRNPPKSQRNEGGHKSGNYRGGNKRPQGERREPREPREPRENRGPKEPRAQGGQGGKYYTKQYVEKTDEKKPDTVEKTDK